MEKMLTVAFLVALSVSVAAQSQGTIEDLKMNASSTYVSLKVKGIVSISKQPDIVNDANKITVKIHKLEEILSNGSIVDNADPSDLNWGLESAPVQDDDSLRGTTVAGIKLKGGTFKIIFAIYRKTAKVTIDDENTNVKAGDIGMTFQLSGHTLSKDDNKLKMTLMIKGKSASPTEITTNKGTDGLAYDLGGNGVLRLSKKVKLSSTKTTDDTVSANGDKFTVEFGKGDALEYRLFITPADVPSSISSGGSGNSTGNNTNLATKSSSLGLAMMAILMLLHTVY